MVFYFLGVEVVVLGNRFWVEVLGGYDRVIVVVVFFFVLFCGLFGLC